MYYRQKERKKMRILFLHLSDLHTENEPDLNLPRVRSLVRSLQGFGSINGIVIAISGDLAMTGKRSEYELVSQFLNCLLKNINDTYALDGKDIKVLLIPGNHDIDWGDSRSISPENIRQMSDIGFGIPNGTGEDGFLLLVLKQARLFQHESLSTGREPGFYEEDPAFQQRLSHRSKPGQYRSLLL